MSIGRKYKCGLCNKEFKAAWTEEEAKAEMIANFGDVPEEDQAVVCDDCYNKMIGEYPPEQYLKDSSKKINLNKGYVPTKTNQEKLASIKSQRDSLKKIFADLDKQEKQIKRGLAAPKS